MKRIELFCDVDGNPLPIGAAFDHLTLEVNGVHTTWELCPACAKTMMERFEKDFAFTRHRPKEVKAYDAEFAAATGQPA